MMTAKLRTLIELRDIIGIEYECANCHTRYGVLIDSFARRTTQCPNCRLEWMEGGEPIGDGISNDQLLSQLIERLKLVQGRTFGAAIRFEINGDAKP
jgi:DNA-directed RNA polymerase subunit RPC12/RpoP